MLAQSKDPKVFEVSLNGETYGFCALVGPEGFIGDESGTHGVVIVSVEVMREINDAYNPQLRQLLEPGKLGDNILTENLGDLSDLEPGNIILVNKAVELRVEAHASHYRKMFSKILPEEVLSILDTRGGVTCSVQKGVGVRIRNGEEIEILR